MGALIPIQVLTHSPTVWDPIDLHQTCCLHQGEVHLEDLLQLLRPLVHLEVILLDLHSPEERPQDPSNLEDLLQLPRPLLLLLLERVVVDLLEQLERKRDLDRRREELLHHHLAHLKPDHVVIPQALRQLLRKLRLTSTPGAVLLSLQEAAMLTVISHRHPTTVLAVSHLWLSNSQLRLTN